MKISVVNVLQSRIGGNLHLYKQAAATFASCLLSLSAGVTFGLTAVLLPQLKQDNDYPYDEAYNSSIASISPLAMMFGCIFSGSLSDAIGRRKGQIFLIIPFTLGWIILGIARNNHTMLLGRFITGICAGAVRPLGLVYIGEVSDPKYRSITLFCPALAINIGVLFCHTIGHYYPWRTVCFVYAIPNLICLCLLLLMKESPIWMITNGHTELGVETFKWFRGDGESVKKELKSVLDNQDNNAPASSMQQFLSVTLTKPFLKSVVVVFFVFVAVQLSGINTISFYALDIFKSTFGGDVDPFTLMLITDVIRFICVGVMCIIAKRLPRKKTFLACCFGVTTILLGFVIYLLLKPEGFLWLAVTCLVAYIVIASILTCISWSFVAEIFPSKVRGFGSGISSLMSFSLLFTSVQFTPSIISILGEAAMYGSFAVSTMIAAIVLCFILPETNGKSLQDIEDSLYKKKENIEMSSKSQTINRDAV